MTTTPTLTTIVGSTYVRAALGISPAELSRRIAAGVIEPAGQLSETRNGAYIFDKAVIDAMAAAKSVTR